MLSKIYKNIVLLTDMYYYRKKLFRRYRRFKQYQRKGIIKIDKPKKNKLEKNYSRPVCKTPDVKSLVDLITDELSLNERNIYLFIYKDIITKIYKVDIYYHDCIYEKILQKFNITDNYNETQLYEIIVSNVQRRIDDNMFYTEYNISNLENRILSSLKDETFKYMYENDINISIIPLKEKFTFEFNMGDKLNDPIKFETNIPDIHNKLAKAIEEVIESLKIKELQIKNNPLNLKVGNIYLVRYMYNSSWNKVEISRFTKDQFPWAVGGIITPESWDVKTPGGRWIHDCNAWNAFIFNKSIKEKALSERKKIVEEINLINALDSFGNGSVDMLPKFNYHYE